MSVRYWGLLALSGLARSGRRGETFWRRHLRGLLRHEMWFSLAAVPSIQGPGAAGGIGVRNLLRSREFVDAGEDSK